MNSGAISDVPAIIAPDDPPVRESPTPWTTTFFLQISQRLGAIALLSTLGTWAMLYLAKDATIPIAITVGAGLVGLCSAMVARMLTHRATPARSEANGIAIFNLVLLVLAVHLMLYTRLDVIRASASEFFTPTPQPTELDQKIGMTNGPVSGFHVKRIPVIAAGEGPPVERRSARLADRPAACWLRLLRNDTSNVCDPSARFSQSGRQKSSKENRGCEDICEGPDSSGIPSGCSEALRTGFG